MFIRLAWGLFATGAAEVITAAILWMATGQDFAVAVKSYVVTDCALGTAFLLCGVLLACQRPRNPIGWLFLAGGLAHAMTAVSVSLLATGVQLSWPTPVLLGLTTVAVCSWPWALGLCIPLALLIFPNGRLPSRRWRPITGATILFAVLFVLWSASDTGQYPISAGPGYLAVSSWAYLQPLRPTIELVSIVSLLLPGLVALVGRYRRGDDKLRRQMLWLILAVVGFVPWSLLGVTADSVQLLIILQPAAITVAILRYQLLDIRLVVSRALLYLVLSAGVVGVYAGAVLLLDHALNQAFGLGSAALVTVGVAVMFNPARIWLQHLIDRLFYGSRGDPVRALGQVGARLQTASGSLEDLLAAVRNTLRLPYAAFRIEGRQAAASGRPVTTLEMVPLRGPGAADAELVVGIRSGQDRLDAEDLQVLRVLLVPLTVALRATVLSAELQSARERLVATREEERRRLRRDLHDGLGPTLAAIALGLPVAKNNLDRDPIAAGKLLGELGKELQGAIGEIRRIARDLHPSVLDQLGLVTAIREHASTLASRLDNADSRVRILIDAPDQLRPLPAAIEVAAYRIICEALTNVARHAHARECQVRMWVGNDLCFEVTDDGVGLNGAPRPGVGLASMRDRATELGGDCVVSRVREGGTRVCAKLPLPK